MLRGLLQPYIDQISSLHIRFCEDDYDNTPDSELMFTDFPALQELSVRVHHHAMPAITQFISRFPLCSLEVIRPLFYLELLSSCNPMWANLTNVDVTLRKNDAVLRLLQLGPNLSLLTIHVAFEELLLIDLVELFTPTKLQSLRIASLDLTEDRMDHVVLAIHFPCSSPQNSGGTDCQAS
ncbi:uncharacterized protein EDB91DRAFT_1114549 [Suillus paluster]|uniref:uncharacterized protein n=1 Tax=Suillus paluster TaxID=48578 RepID=UPI001B87400B|nr:uncharacterized protein EDB91DRAFT_1114549 [Suillus paluster]KAG1747730.1 hypothetical protein EDB91DRAFT_1114549 [Suillus paluster]